MNAGLYSVDLMKSKTGDGSMLGLFKFHAHAFRANEPKIFLSFRVILQLNYRKSRCGQQRPSLESLETETDLAGLNGCGEAIYQRSPVILIIVNG